MIRNVSLGFCLTIALCFVSSADAASLRAKVGSQAYQNEKADEDNLSRILDDEMAARWIRLELLVPIEGQTSSYYLHAVPSGNRYLRPWAKLFLARLSRQFRARFGRPLRVTSLLRSAEYQVKLQGRNGNAAAATGPKASSHLTGAAMDISKKGMTGREIAWMRNVLSSLREKQYLHAIEEWKQPVFHIMIFRNYEDYVEEKLSAQR